jgi:hypothetical protein
VLSTGSHLGVCRQPARENIDELERRAPGGRAALWQVGRLAFGFASHPGLKVAMVEDLVMEFDESAPDIGPGLARSWSVQRELEDALVPIMTGLVQIAGWMDEAAQPRQPPSSTRSDADEQPWMFLSDDRLTVILGCPRGSEQRWPSQPTINLMRS